MKYLKALLVVVITACTFGSAFAQPSHPHHHHHHRHHHHGDH